MIRVTDYAYADAVELLARLPKNIDKAVDLGAGKRDSPISLQVADIRCNHLISVEAFEPYLPYLLSTAVEAKIHDVVKAHIVNSNYKVPKCDLVIMIDVIEHLETLDAYDLLDYLKTVTKCIVIFTPEGDTIGYSNNDMGNPLQEHKSRWYAENFEAMGFEVTVYENFHNHLGDGRVGGLWAIWKLGENVQ